MGKSSWCSRNLNGFSAFPTLEQPLQALQRSGHVAGQRLDYLDARPGQGVAVNCARLSRASRVHLVYLGAHVGEPVAEPDQGDGALAPDVPQGGIGESLTLA